ncbi:DUF2189 domain-containing protein [Pontixanthobacter aquaemixtae]|uniref:DUF2189 domain-containing protein n=1 Tax=Pontixanthobacter aquaemixtae TaxID=1958940 RepID=A0A844ZN40_9SPHN|nr:DUF2189 domain-containing protein [Pontixanthobacter aquaemixtae]MXO89265.1 DUF2189 domain-containing protein [Pontixanthobacter aquaemixtae]
MDSHEESAPTTTAIATDLKLADLRTALSAGWADFVALPAYGLCIALAFVLSGLAFSYLLFMRGEYVWLIAAAAGFPVVAPFAAVCLYEVSRRRERGLPVNWGVVLQAVGGRGDEQILSMGVLLFVAFSFWTIVAHTIFSIFVVEAGAGSETLEFLATTLGVAMLLVGGIAGALIALVFYTITVVSLPMLVDREVDFLTAIITSLRAFRANLVILLCWAVIIATSLFVAIVSLFLGLLIALPVLGHATWHLYRRVVQPQD